MQVLCQRKGYATVINVDAASVQARLYQLVEELRGAKFSRPSAVSKRDVEEFYAAKRI